jgi:hypothetical protein
VLQRALQPFRRSRLLRTLLGPCFRPPIGVLRVLRVRIDDTAEEYLAEARRHPLFELRPRSVTPADGLGGTVSKAPDPLAWYALA